MVWVEGDGVWSVATGFQLVAINIIFYSRQLRLLERVMSISSRAVHSCLSQVITKVTDDFFLRHRREMTDNSARYFCRYFNYFTI